MAQEDIGGKAHDHRAQQADAQIQGKNALVNQAVNGYHSWDTRYQVGDGCVRLLH